MRRARWTMLAVAAAGLVWLADRGSAGTVAKPKAGAKPAPAAPKASASAWKTARPVLPDWAPKNPSPEFLRAARVLKPMPLDIMKAEGQPEAENAARVAGAILMWPAAYEFFGTLSDEQIDRFLQSDPKYLVIPMRQLTKKQRDALDRYFEAWRTATKGQFPEIPVILYKDGAKRDLSNVWVGFDAGKHMGGGHYVHLYFQVRTAKGETGGFGSNFAQI